MPGVGKDDVEVLVGSNLLFIKGERQMGPGMAGMVYKYSTTYYVEKEKFNLNKLKAVMKNGVLNVMVPKVSKGD